MRRHRQDQRAAELVFRSLHGPEREPPWVRASEEGRMLDPHDRSAERSCTILVFGRVRYRVVIAAATILI
jgi:hypothetical protein